VVPGTGVNPALEHFFCFADLFLHTNISLVHMQTALAVGNAYIHSTIALVPSAYVFSFELLTSP